MLEVFYNVLFPVVLIFAAGYLIGKLFPVNRKSFSTISIYLLTPALVFSSIYENKDFFSGTTLNIFIVITITIILTILAVELLDVIFHFERAFKTILLLALILTNSGNFGLPVTQYAFGKEGLLLGTLAMVFYIFYTHTAGVFIAASDKSNARDAFLQMLKIPVFYSFVAAMALNYFKIPIPGQVLNSVRELGYSGITLNLLFVGITLSDIHIKKKFLSVFLISFAKLVIIPLIAFPLLLLFGLKGFDLKVTLTQIAMPSAIYCSILASHFNSDVKLASEIVLASLLLSIVSLSGIIYLLNLFIK